MTTEIEIEHLIKSTFPEFEITEEMAGVPVVTFSFLSIWLQKALVKKDQPLINRFINFIDLFVERNDKLSLACLSEIFLGLYTSEEIDFYEFKSKLSESASKMFQDDIDAWNSQY